MSAVKHGADVRNEQGTELLVQAHVRLLLIHSYPYRKAITTRATKPLLSRQQLEAKKCVAQANPVALHDGYSKLTRGINPSNAIIFKCSENSNKTELIMHSKNRRCVSPDNSGIHFNLRVF